MACRVAENKPLDQLREDIGLPRQCHSLRPHCIEGHPQRSGNAVLGIPGAVIGYCQALFQPSHSPLAHTEKVKKLLEEIEAPWSDSHELFWGYRNEESPDEFIEQAIRPLLGAGRIPILITGLEVSKDKHEIRTIVDTTPKLHNGETALLRVVLSDDDAVPAAAHLVTRLTERAKQRREMPPWWPLLQGNLSADGWRRLRDGFGECWRYANIAVNPFTAQQVMHHVADQVTVAQVVVGASEGISNDGTIRLAPGMKISGAQEEDSYDIMDYAALVSELDVAPTLIVLGPALEGWSDSFNQKRIAALLPVLERACNRMWNQIEENRRRAIWKMSA